MNKQQLKDDADNNSSSANNCRSSGKRKQEEVYEQGGDDSKEDTSSLKKPRLAWSVELHQHFVDAVNQLGIYKAVPKKILEMMNVPGLTRENIASHLQKYRIYLRRLREVSQKQGDNNHLFATAQDPNVGLLSTLSGFNLQDFSDAGQLRAHSLSQHQASGLVQPSSLTKPGMSVSPFVDQRSVSSFDNPAIRFGNGQMMNGGGGGNKQIGVPTMRVEQQPTAGQNVQSSGILMPVGGGPFGQQQPILSSSVDAVAAINSIRGITRSSSVFNNFPSELPRHSFPLASAPGISVSYQEEVGSSSSAASNAGFGIPSYDIFNGFPQQHNNRLNDWDMWNTGRVFNSHQNTAAATASAAVSTSEAYGHHRQIEQPAPRRRINHMDQVYMNGGSVRVKSERVAETVTCPPATAPFDDQYDQEDLMSAFLNFDG